MDFLQVGRRETKSGNIVIYPDFVVGHSKDLMIRGRSFYAIWNPNVGLWSTDEYDVQTLVDAELTEQAPPGASVRTMRSFSSNEWAKFRRFLSQMSDQSKELDPKLTFADTKVRKSDYATKRLPYNLESGEHAAWDRIVGTLYSPEEREKIEWAIGAVVSGDSKKIQKFLVFYGKPGTGKSTIMTIVEQLFDGYIAHFEAKGLTSNNAAFAMEPFRSNPLVAIQHDGDLSRIEDNTRLNSIIAHEPMQMNEKYKPSYTVRIRALLMMGTNLPVRISDAKSGIIRRLIDVRPTGNLIPVQEYNDLMDRIPSELGAIANHCLGVYTRLGKNYYNGYRAVEMMFQTDVFLNYVEAHWDIFKAADGVTLRMAYDLYKKYCEETGVPKQLPQYKVREELRNYFDEFHERIILDGVQTRSYYRGFKTDSLSSEVTKPKPKAPMFPLTTSLLDACLADCPAQYATNEGIPSKPWANVATSLSDLDTSQTHYVRPPKNHIVIDFDIKGPDGRKSAERNDSAAAEWPPTYGERSAGGSGVHLHYLYDGDPELLCRNHSDGIEIKVFSGLAALRRRLTTCNDLPIAHISEGLPVKEKPVLSQAVLTTERGLRDLVLRNLRKEIHPGTKPSIDFIKHILDEAYSAGFPYDLTDLRSRIVAFANGSTNHAMDCIKTAQHMKFKSDETAAAQEPKAEAEGPLVFFDVEVFPNLLVVCWKYQGADEVVAMINPTPAEVERLFSLLLVGFNVRRYDNHILYGRYLGYNNEQLYRLSQSLIGGNGLGGTFGEAFHLSYADVYDFSSKKQGLKRFQIELGIPHVELPYAWDQPVPEECWPTVVEYCKNDVRSLEVVFDSRKADFVARQILAKLSGLSVNDTTAKHTARILFGSDRNPQRRFVYTNLATLFPGYSYEMGKSTYRDETVGEGGYVYAEPGTYSDVALLDVASMHPTSIILLNLFGDEYTRRFSELVDARLAIKHKDYERAKHLLGGALQEFLGGSENDADRLAYALKIVINIVYGLTSAKFDNPFRDIRNKDNIVAKRGALFMIDLMRAVQERGFTVAHIKTDSIKIPNATPEIIEFVMEFGKRYGYTFEHEGTYESFCLVNDAVYIAKKELHDFDGDKPVWTAVGAQFQHPYVFKSLFSGEPIEFADLCETKTVTQGAIYLDFDYENPPTTPEDVQRMRFVGRTGSFVPICEGFGGGKLYRVKDGKYYAVAGSKGYLWVEALNVENLLRDVIDFKYFEDLCNNARKQIEKFTNFEDFVNGGSHDDSIV